MVSGFPVRSRLPLAAVLGLVAIGSGGAGAQVSRLSQIELPDGFSITFFAENVAGARSLAQSPAGTVFVGSRPQGVVYALVDSDADGEADRTHRLAEGLNSPNGVAFRNGSLYVAEISRILRYDNVEGRLDSPPSPAVVTASLPRHRSHGWKFIRFGPDGRLYVPVGAPCNICDAADPYASILRLAGDGGYEIVARGVRNTVGFDWHPTTGRLWFTDNGRDWLGDDSPPDELNVLTSTGQHFGYPYCHGRSVADPEFGDRRSCSEFRPPVQALGPHVAALGMRFYTGTAFPERYRGQIFIAEHGSWNRTVPIGYRVMLVRLGANGRPTAYEEFATGWLQGGTAWGRPVDVMVRDDGSLLVSDDRLGVIYRITHASAADPPPDPEPEPPGNDGPCESGGETLCVRDGRYEVKAEWWTAGGEPGPAFVAEHGTPDSGMFWFLDPSNWEILVKVLDGCKTNGHIWVYGASTTNLGYSIRVRDTLTGEESEYRNEAGEPAPAITDNRAFSRACTPSAFVP